MERAGARDQRLAAVAGWSGPFLSQGQVDVLLVHDDAADDADHGTAWFDPPDPVLCAGGAEDLRQLGVETVCAARLADIGVRAALLTGAAVRVVPAHGGPSGGVGAVLRWAG